MKDSKSKMLNDRYFKHFQDFENILFKKPQPQLLIWAYPGEYICICHKHLVRKACHHLPRGMR